MSAQKALQGSETETRELLGGMEEKIHFPRRGVIDLPSGQINIFLKNRKQKNIELVSRPAAVVSQVFGRQNGLAADREW